MTSFTPLTSFAGGMLIGLAAVLLMAFHGRIFGATGILSGLMRGNDARDWWLRAALLAGMVLAPGLVLLVTGSWPRLNVPVSMTAIIGGGLLVGIGVSFGGGCTSGHGVCGISRLSLRGIVATVFYIVAGGLTLALLRHVLGVI